MSCQGEGTRPTSSEHGHRVEVSRARIGPDGHSVTVASSVRRVTGNRDFVDTAPLDLVFIADHARTKLVPVAMRTACAHVSAGAMALSGYLYCASERLATVIRAWFNRNTLASAMGLQTDHQSLL